MIKNVAPWLDGTPDVARYPALKGAYEADVVVVGAGIVGTLAAWHCARRGLRTVLIEKNRVATGDTGATTGFLTKVPDTSIAGLSEARGAEYAAGVFAATAGAQRELVALIEEQGIECGLTRCNAYWCAYGSGDPALVREGAAVRAACPDASIVTGADAAGAPFAEAIKIPGEAKYDPRRFLIGLLEKAGRSLTIFEGTEASSVAADGDRVVVRTDGGSVTARKLIVATGRPFDAFAELHSLVEPKITYVIAAKYDRPVLGDDVYWDTLDPYFYYRTVDRDTVIVGGCDVPHDEAGKSEPFEALAAFLRERIPGDLTIVRRWSGSIFHTSDGLPYAFAHPHTGGKVLVGTGFGGNGMVFGALVARALAAMAAGEEDPAASYLALARTGATVAAPAKSGSQEITAFVPAAKTSDLAGSPMRCATVAGRKIVIVKTADGLHALDNACSHQGGSLCDGELEGTVVQCPLHGARFDVRTGAVVGPPATRSQRSYEVKVVGDDIMVGPSAASAAAPPPPAADAPDPEAIERGWGSFFRFAAFAGLFWLAQFLYQYLHLTKGEIGGSLVRSFALSGATFIGTALSMSAVFKWRPALSVHWRLRRRFGVAGFTFISLHAFSVLKFFFNFDPAGIFWSLNPLENPIIFGEIAFFLFFLMAATSFDLAVEKLGKHWKRLHRVAYFAWWAAIFHFITINPDLLKNPPGYVLLAVTAFSLFGQLYWYVRIAGRKRFMTVGGAIGAIVIALYIGAGYLVYQRNAPAPAEPAAGSDLTASIDAMKRYMAENPADPDVAREPIGASDAIGGAVLRSGSFRNINYMTSGTATIRDIGGRAHVVFGDDFETPNGPDLRVYLTKNGGPTGRDDIRAGIPLGKLKSVLGAQAYEIPAGTPLNAYASVSIHCQAFNVPWSYAPFEE